MTVSRTRAEQRAVAHPVTVVATLATPAACLPIAGDTRRTELPGLLQPPTETLFFALAHDFNLQ